MGVRGLMSFFASQDYVCDKHALNNTAVVIDGSNLHHMLYYSGQGCGSIAWTFGGQYKQFERRVRKFFKNLEQCGVKPYVLCDGCYETNNQKLRTIRERRVQRLRTLCYINKSSLGGFDRRCKGSSIPPLLGEAVFLDTLRDMSIPFMVTLGEADSIIASLANELNAPVLSWDSDFYIFPLQAGFIPLDTLSWNRVVEDENGQHHLSCQLYHQKNVYLSGNRLVKPQFFSLFASLMGNDFIKKSDMDPFFQHVFHRVTITRQSDSKQKRFENTSRTSKHRQMIDLLEWLHQYSDTSEALTKICQYFPEDRRGDCLAKLQLSLAQYETEDVSAILAFLSEQLDAKRLQCVEQLASRNSSHFVSSLPSSLKLAFFEGQLPNWFSNAINAKHTFEPIFIEDVSKKSAFHMCLPIRRAGYQLVFQAVGPENHPRSICITEEGHKNIFAKKRLCHFTLKRGPDNESPSLEVLLGLLISDAHSLQLPQSDLFQDRSNPILAVWILMKMWSHYVLSSETAPRDELISLSLLIMMVSLLCRPDGDKIPPGFVKLQSEPVVNHSRKFNLVIVHCFNQVQVLYSHLRLLNVLLGKCLPNLPPPSLLFDGYVFYNLCQEMFRRPEPLGYALELCGGKKAQLCLTFSTLLHELFPSFGFHALVRGSKTKKTKEVNHPPQVTENVISSVSDSDSDVQRSDSSSGEISVPEEDGYEDVENRFSGLYLVNS